MSNAIVSDRELAKILVRTFSKAIVSNGTYTAKFVSNFTSELVAATGGCPVKISLALEIIKEVKEELLAEAQGLAVQNVKPPQGRSEEQSK